MSLYVHCSHVDFEESQELCVLDIFAHMEIPLLHCWMVDPEDLTICPNILSFSYEKLQKYIKVVENVSGALQASDVAAKRENLFFHLFAHLELRGLPLNLLICVQVQ